MSIFDIIEESKYKKAREENFSALEHAAEVYDKQKKSIRAIVKTDGYKEILGYWQREKELYENRLVQNPKDKDSIIEGFKISKRFVEFLENISS